MATVDWQRVQGAGLLDEVLASSAPEIDIGDRYEIGACIGSGGQGQVYRARDCLLGRDVAVKLVHERAANRHLQAEAALLARLSHPAIPSVYDRGMAVDGRAFMVMELVVGRPLKQAIDDPQWPLRERLRVFRAVAAAIAHAHQRGILHRDCKPGNIALRDDGEAFLLDWGLAATGDPRAICGTPCYAAPEQLNGQVADRRSDVYSLGVLLYQVISGQLPFARVVNDFAEFRAQRAGLGLIPLRRHCPDLRPSYQRVIDRAMSAQPAARYERCQHLIADIDALIAGERVSVDPYQWRIPKGVLIAAAAVVLAFAVGWWWPQSQSPDWPSAAGPSPSATVQPFADQVRTADPSSPWASADESLDSAHQAPHDSDVATAAEESAPHEKPAPPVEPAPALPPLIMLLPTPASPHNIESEEASLAPEQAAIDPAPAPVEEPAESEEAWNLLQLPSLDEVGR